MLEGKKCKKKVSQEIRYAGNDIIDSFVSENKEMRSSLEKIKNILCHEGYGGQSRFKNETALNLDKYELLRLKGKVRDNTVDFVVGLRKNWLLLVEAKFRVKNVENIRNLPDKISHSKELLQAENTFVHALRTVVVLLPEFRFQQQSNMLQKLMISRYRQIRPMTVSKFYQEYFQDNS